MHVQTSPVAVAETAELLDKRQAAAIANVSTRSWERLCDAGKAPRPVRLSARLIRWRRSDISKWLASRCEAE
ncbi:MAG: hypothetical protein AMXMBFR47_08260 [Planctomycetota bacterium]